MINYIYFDWLTKKKSTNDPIRYLELKLKYIYIYAWTLEVHINLLEPSHRP